MFKLDVTYDKSLAQLSTFIIHAYPERKQNNFYCQKQENTQKLI